MPCLQLAFAQVGLHGLGQLQEPQQVGGGTARAAHSLGGLLMGQPELLDEPGNALRLFKRRKVSTLQILDERHGQGRLVVHGLDHSRNLREPSELGGSEAALAGDDLVGDGVGSGADGPHDDGLQHALPADGIGKLLKPRLIHDLPRLVTACLQRRERQGHQTIGGLLHGRGGAQQDF